MDHRSVPLRLQIGTDALAASPTTLDRSWLGEKRTFPARGLRRPRCLGVRLAYGAIDGALNE
jgi:hypothetical protein